MFSLQKLSLFLVTVVGILYMGLNCAPDKSQQAKVFMGTGIKIGEVTANSAIIWTRLTRVEDPDTAGIKFNDFSEKEFIENKTMGDVQNGPGGGFASQLPKGVSLEQVEGAVPGTNGEVRVTWMEKGKENTKKVIGWSSVDENRDYTRHFTLTDLKPATEYAIIVEGRKSASSQESVVINSSFLSAAQKNQPQEVLFTVVTGTQYDTRDAGNRGHHFYQSMLQLKPNFFVHTGDIVYYDHPNPYVTHIDLARFSWDRMFGLPNSRAFFNNIPAYFMKDDHDSWDNDCWPSMPGEMGLFTYEQGLQVFDEQVPMSDKKHYRTFRWGQDLQIWLVEGRDYRSPNHDPDGPEKTMWGKEQVDWFMTTVKESDATFKMLISPTPLVGPDHLWKAEMSDNLADKDWSFEGDKLRDYISQQKNMYIICGDRHWQYVSKHKKTGILEYCSGPSTDKHATTIQNPDRSMHLYYQPNGGFLAVTINRIQDVPTATFHHYGATGQLHNEDIRVAQE